MSKVMGFQGQWFHGTSGTSAATQILNLTDANYNVDLEMGNTTSRGDGSAPPIDTESVTVRKVSALDITMIHDTSDASFTALETAARAGTAISLKNKSYSSGKGFDGDVYVKMDRGEPLRGEATAKFSFSITTDGGRAPQLNAS